MRGNFVRRRPRRPKAAVPRPAPVLKAPDTAALGVAFEALLTLDQVARLEALKRALTWYDSALDYVAKIAWTPDRQRLLELRMKVRAQGESTTFQGEAETAFRKAVEFSERIVAGLIVVPGVADVYERLKTEQEQLEKNAAAQRLADQALLNQITAALQPKVFLALGGTAGRDFNPTTRTVSYGSTLIRDLHTKKEREGLLPMLLGEVVPLAKAASVEQTGAGWAPNLGVMLGEVEAYQRNIALYLRALGGNVRVFVARGAAHAPRVPHMPVPDAGPAQPRAQGKGCIPGTPIKKGSDLAKIYTILLDGKHHGWASLQTEVKANVRNRVSRLKQIGRKTNQWTIYMTSNEVWLEGRP